MAEKGTHAAIEVSSSSSDDSEISSSDKDSYSSANELGDSRISAPRPLVATGKVVPARPAEPVYVQTSTLTTWDNAGKLLSHAPDGVASSRLGISGTSGLASGVNLDATGDSSLVDRVDTQQSAPPMSKSFGSPSRGIAHSGSAGSGSFAPAPGLQVRNLHS